MDRSADPEKNALKRADSYLKRALPYWAATLVIQ